MYGLQAIFDGSGLGKLDGLNTQIAKRQKSRWLMILAAMICAACFLSSANLASAETRTLKLYYLHTGERSEITFKRNGRYIDGGLKKINRFLRDWRRNEPTKMDPKLLDLVWEVYKDSGSKKHIHVISGYRSPATNNLLRKRGRGVARKSQHTLGKALDFFIPGVPLKKLRNIALRKGLGGVGYYPKSGSPFIHMDTGRVRHWPRMSRKELVSVFPKGDTLHVPTDGKPLARYNQAKATYERKIKGRDKIVVAKAEEIEKKPGFFSRVLGRDDEEDGNATGIVAAPRAVRTTVQKPAATATANPAPEPKPLGTIPGFEAPSAPEPAPTPEPTPETILASLPVSSLPVPLIAPRTIAVAEVEQPNPETELEVVDSASSEQLDLASAFPAKRPEDASPKEEVVLAEASDIAPALTAYQRLEQANASALSPTEIEDLRQQVYATLREDRQNLPKKPVPSVPIPEAENIVVASATNAEDPFENTPGVLTVGAENSLSEQDPNRIVETFGNALTQPSTLSTLQQSERVQPLEDAPEPDEATPGFIVPEPNPARIEVASLEATGTSLSPIEPGVISRDVTAVPSPNPDRPAVESVETAIAGAVEEPPLDEQTVAGLAVPTPAFRNTPEPIEEQIVVASATPQPTYESRELALERFQAPGTDERLVGKYALAGNTTISQISEIRPPAYGRNIIRELPVTVLSRGFSRESIERFTAGFTGSSLEFLDFKKFN